MKDYLEPKETRRNFLVKGGILLSPDYSPSCQETWWHRLSSLCKNTSAFFR